MTAKTFIEMHTTSKKHIIFTGKNALFHAMFYDEHGRLPTSTEVYHYRTQVDAATYWGNGYKSSTKMGVRGTEVVATGVHAKIYTRGTSVIYSSQNNASSALFEFAILYSGVGGKLRRLRQFTTNTISRARDYSRWWIANKKWGT